MDSFLTRRFVSLVVSQYQSVGGHSNDQGKFFKVQITIAQP